jgi:hypothetical protein
VIPAMPLLTQVSCPAAFQVRVWSSVAGTSRLAMLPAPSYSNMEVEVLLPMVIGACVSPGTAGSGRSPSWDSITFCETRADSTP